MSDSSQIHRGFMALSCHFHGTFLSASDSSRIHVTFMAVSWQFHGTFTYKPYLGTVCQNLLEKVIQKVGVGCRFGFFCLISASFLAICQIHVGFMALSWRFLSWHGTCMADSWQIHGTFMALSWHFPGTFLHVWICHESAMKVP